jgi:hypothetical protein
MVMSDDPEGLRGKLAALLPHLDERQRRLVMGAEARALGHGGIKKVAAAVQVSAVTVSRGIAELEAGDQPLQRTRRPGGGRKKLMVTDPGLRMALFDVLEARSPDPTQAPLRWTTKSLRSIAAELAHSGHRVSAPTVASLLRQENFSLYASARQVDGGQRTDREAQFRYINDQAAAHLAAGQPVVSVEARRRRKQELAGEPMSDGTGPGSGWSVVACDPDTAAFAAAAIRSWWARIGRAECPAAARLMICPNGSGPNDFCGGAWQAELVRLADETGLRVTCCHLPPGTSKWHQIEHRLFSDISTSWHDKPMVRHEAIVSLIASTVISGPGHESAARADSGGEMRDPTRELIPPDPATWGQISRHDRHPEWNYCISPANQR